MTSCPRRRPRCPTERRPNAVRTAGRHRVAGLEDLPGLHELRRARPRQPPVDAAPRSERRPFIRQALEAGHQLLRHRQRLLGRQQRGDPRPGAAATSPTATRSSSPPRCTAGCGEGANGGGLSRKAIMTEIDHSLRRLGTDYVDLYQIHRWDPSTPIEETLEALHDVVKAGKARYIGASSMWAWQFAKAPARRRAQRLDPVRQHAGPLQPAAPRGGAGDAAALRRTRASA